MNFQSIDKKALNLAGQFKKCEAELLEIIIQVDRFKVFRKLGYSSLFQYVVKRLKLSESQAYGFINVARKSHEVPKLKESIKKGNLSISKARRITSVINKTNQDQWLKLAESATQAKVEREVALATPRAMTVEKMIYKSSDNPATEKVKVKRDVPRVQLEVGLSEKIMLKLRRAQDLVSQKRKSSQSLESTLENILDDYLYKHDPVEKAKRQQIKAKLIEKNKKEADQKLSERNKQGKKKEIKNKEAYTQASKTKPSLLPTTSLLKSKLEQSSRRVISEKSNNRKPLPARLKHLVYLRDKGRCTSLDPDGERCCSRRFLEIHHIKPLSQGGSDSLDNLTLLCSNHHKMKHDY